MTSTSVKVALRVRPLNPNETIKNSSKCLKSFGDSEILFGKDDRSFTFDHLFHPDIEQEEVFNKCAQPLVDKFVEGYNATILAYGQTGSGKTYSMGMGTTLDAQGIVPRAIIKLFEDINKRKESYPSYRFEVCVSFLELYNENFIDLLNCEKDKKKKNELRLREDANGQVFCSGVKGVPVSSPEELLSQLQKGLSCRAVASTEMNSKSSRSHAIFSVMLRQEDLDEENKENDFAPAESSAASRRKSEPKPLSPKIVSKLHFVDLAGSERLKKTNSVGDRAKEGIAINEGLLALGNVISALCNESGKVTHIPYRDSKLTRLLQDSLGGNSQTLMLACVSPADSSSSETLNTLKYADRVRNIENKISKCYDGNSVEINQLRGQINKLKSEYEGKIKFLREELHEKDSLLQGILDDHEHTIQKYKKEIRKLKSQADDNVWDRSIFYCPTKRSKNSTGSNEQQRICDEFYDEMMDWLHENKYAQHEEIDELPPCQESNPSPIDHATTFIKSASSHDNSHNRSYDRPISSFPKSKNNACSDEREEEIFHCGKVTIMQGLYLTKLQRQKDVDVKRVQNIVIREIDKLQNEYNEAIRLSIISKNRLKTMFKCQCARIKRLTSETSRMICLMKREDKRNQHVIQDLCHKIRKKRKEVLKTGQKLTSVVTQQVPVIMNERIT